MAVKGAVAESNRPLWQLSELASHQQIECDNSPANPVFDYLEVNCVKVA